MMQMTLLSVLILFPSFFSVARPCHFSSPFTSIFFVPSPIPRFYSPNDVHGVVLRLHISSPLLDLLLLMIKTKRQVQGLERDLSRARVSLTTQEDVVAQITDPEEREEAASRLKSMEQSVTELIKV